MYRKKKKLEQLLLLYLSPSFSPSAHTLTLGLKKIVVTSPSSLSSPRPHFCLISPTRSRRPLPTLHILFSFFFFFLIKTRGTSLGRRRIKEFTYHKTATHLTGREEGGAWEERGTIVGAYFFTFSRHERKKKERKEQKWCWMLGCPFARGAHSDDASFFHIS